MRLQNNFAYGAKFFFFNLNLIYEKFPYSPLLIGIGLVFGLIAEHFGELGESWEYISSIHPVIFSYF